MYNFVFSGTMAAIDFKDKAFFKRIELNRPSVFTMAVDRDNTLPDYYGEKVTSVAGYRKWLKRQRDYRIKNEGIKSLKTKLH
jgi:mitochondrial import inner membrane translocase subunit TIM23